MPNVFICFRAQGWILERILPNCSSREIFMEYMLEETHHKRRSQQRLVEHEQGRLLRNCNSQCQASAEQQKIADCLTSLDELIAAHGRKLDALKAHKKGLMQQLFPREGETHTPPPLPRIPRCAGVGMQRLIRNCLETSHGAHSESSAQNIRMEEFHGSQPIMWISTIDMSIQTNSSSEDAVSRIRLRKYCQSWRQYYLPCMVSAGNVALCRNAGELICSNQSSMCRI